MNGHFPTQPFGFSPFLGLHGVKNRSWYSYHVAIFSLFSLKTGPNAAVNETSTDPSASRAAELFSRLIRMNEGEAHAPLKRRLQQGLAELDLSATHLLLLTQRWLKRLPEGPSLNTLCRHLPVLVLADALGFAPQLRLVEWISQLVATYRPLVLKLSGFRPAWRQSICLHIFQGLGRSIAACCCRSLISRWCWQI